MPFKLSTDSIRTIATFEKITKVSPRDCLITENCIYFLVDPKKIGLAIGKSGVVVKELRRVFGKPIKIFGYSSNPEELVRNLIPDLKSIDMNNGTITVTVQPRDRVSVIGRNGSNIKIIREIMHRHCNIKDFKLR